AVLAAERLGHGGEGGGQDQRATDPLHHPRPDEGSSARAHRREHAPGAEHHEPGAEHKRWRRPRRSPRRPIPSRSPAKMTEYRLFNHWPSGRPGSWSETITGRAAETVAPSMTLAASPAARPPRRSQRRRPSGVVSDCPAVSSSI